MCDRRTGIDSQNATPTNWSIRTDSQATFVGKTGDSQETAIMDYVKQVLVYKFWIVFGLAVILPPIGWWSATGKLESEIEQRRTALDGTYNGLPDGANAPNQTWVDAAGKLNEARRSKLEEAVTMVWEQQKSRMPWPDTIQEKMAECPFHGRLPDRDSYLNFPYFFRDAYA